MTSFSDMQRKFSATGAISMSTYRTKYGNSGTSSISMSTLFPQITSISGITNAWATRALSRTYTNPCFTIRRANDNATADVYMTMGGVVTQIIASGVTTTGSNALSNWLGANQGFITTWRDQVGTTNLTQTTNTNQPLYDATSNAVHINNTTSTNIALSYGSAWSITDATIITNIVPVSLVNAYSVLAGADWYFQDSIIGGERGGSTNDWGFVLPAGSNFGIGTGVQDGVASYSLTNGLNVSSVVGFTRTGASGAFTLYRDGASTTSGTRNSTGVLSGPNPTFIGRNSDGAANSRLNAKFYGMIYANTNLSANVPSITYCISN
jgi:hypothetical protein